MTKNELTYLLAYVLLGINERDVEEDNDTEIMNELQIILFPFKDEIMAKYDKMNLKQKKNNFDMIVNAINNCEELNDILYEQKPKEMN